MKKSYLALGLVAAVAMSSCSNDEPMVNPNQQNPAKDLEPISLTLSNSVADVTVGTRGTGTVGSMDVEKNNWKYEDIYVLMTTSDIRCLEASKNMTAAEKAEADLWGFTSAMGDGPFLQEQFDGKFWARPYAKDNKWGLNYFLDQNEWWDGAPVSKYYPMYGESQFFAFYVDDACEAVDAEGKPLYSVTETPFTTVVDKFGGEHIQGGSVFNAFPVINYDNDENPTQMSVNFKIDGSQDLMLGKAEGNYSAQSARKDIVPSIKMNHMLSRLTFNVKKGAPSADMVTIKEVNVYSKSEGNMIVAYKKDAPQALLTWTNEAEKENPVKFSLQQYPAAPVKEGKGHVCLGADDNPIQVLAKVYEPVYQLDEEGENYVTDENGDRIIESYVEADELALRDLYYYKVSGVKTFTYDDGRGRGPITPAVPFEQEQGNVVKGNVDAASYAAAMALVEAAKPELPIASLQTGKDELVPFEHVVLKDFFAENNGEGTVGEAMFVAPGETSYNMELVLQMLVRAEDEKFEGVTDDYYSKELTEEVTLPLTLTMPEGKTFEAGKSYQVNVTIYGMEKIVLEVELAHWVNGGHFDVGGDKDREGIYNENGTHDDSEYPAEPGDDEEQDDEENN